MCGYLTAIGVSILYIKTRERCPSIYSVGSIWDLETFDNSRLRRNFLSVECEGRYKASVVGHSLRPGASVQCEGDNAVSFGRFVGNKADKTTLLGYISSSASAKQPQKSRIK